MQGAEGAVYATTGNASPQVQRYAASRRIEILSGEELWRQAKPWVPHDVREDVQGDARAERNRLGLYSIAAGFAAGLAAMFVIPMLQQGAVDMASAGQDAAVMQTPSSAGSTRSIDDIAMPLPPDLTQEQADARRATAALEVRSMPAVLNATWSTRSTLVVTLRPGTKLVNDLPREMCERILQFEELRYIRMQIETPTEGGDTATTGQVRWRQCR